jgi:hypothetical protein
MIYDEIGDVNWIAAYRDTQGISIKHSGDADAAIQIAPASKFSEALSSEKLI